MQREQIDIIRRFNRTVTQSIGALNEEYLSRERSLGLSRLLWELAPEGSEVRALRGRLGLDSGYLSRQLRRLEAAGMVSTGQAEDDARVRLVKLTEAGAAERQLLDRASDELAASILGPLSPAQREQLVTAMTEVERLLMAARARIEVTDPRTPDARYCLRSYVRELASRFDDGFDPARSISATDEEMTPPRGLLLVTRMQGDPVGCGALKLHPQDGVAEIKRMWTAPQARGLGLGRRMLECLADQAAARGMRILRLETNRSLAEARKLYETAGFTEVSPFSDEPYAHHWYERPLPAANIRPATGRG